MIKLITPLVFLLLVNKGILLSQNLTLIDSLQSALTKSKTPDDSAKTLCFLTWNIGDSNPDLTYKYGMEALGKSKRITNKERLAEVYDAAALAYRVKGNREKAKEFYSKSVEIGNKYNYPNRIAWGNYNLADIALLENRIGDVITYAEKARTMFKHFNDINGVLYSDWLFLRTSKNKNSSNPYIDSTINDYKYAESITSTPDILLDQYLNLVLLYGQKENRSMSMHYALKALELAEKEKNRRGLLKAYFSIGQYLRDYQHNYDVALLYYNKIREIFKEEKLETGNADVLNEIGIVYKLMGNYKVALNYFNNSLEIAKKINHRHSIAYAYQYLGEIAQAEKNYPRALTYYTKCYETGCDQCPKIVFHGVLVEIGNVYLNSGDNVNAMKYFNESFVMADSVNAIREKSISYSALGDLYEITKDYHKAGDYYNRALENAISINSLILRKEISAKLSNVYSKQHNFQKAFELLNISKILADSLNKLSAADNLSELETKFEFQNMKNQKENEIARQSQLKYFFIVSFILALGLGFAIYLGFRRKKKDNITLAQQKEQLEEMTGKIHEADQKRLSFFTNISHELRTPLTLILGPIEKLIKENSVDKSNTPLLGIVRRNTLHLHNLINQLLDIRKLDTGNIKLKVDEEDLTGYCKGMYSIFTHIAEENKINYNFNAPVENIIGWFDRDIIEKVFNNLLSNAFKYTPANGSISVSIIDDSMIDEKISRVKITICDNGKGIPDDQIQYVFDRYYQVENTNTGFNTGTGIGLAYTKELIELHKGKINIESHINEGTKFTITLPVHESFYSPEEKSANGKIAVKAEADDIRLKYLEETVAIEQAINAEEKEIPEDKKVILIVEDNHDLRTFIKSIFRNNYNIIEAPDGEEGLKKATENIPDVIISDIMMPGMNGLEFSSKIKSNPHTSHVPVLILTAKTGEGNEIEGLQSGADDYLTKPFNSEILEMRINRLLDSRERFREYFTKEFLMNPSEVKLTSGKDEFLKTAVKIVEDNILNPDLNVEMLMEQMCISRMQLHRKLKAVTNLSANVFIRNIKLKRAAQLLLHNDMNISQVLFESGFNSPSYFTTCFKEMYGCLPKEYGFKSKIS